MNYSKSKDISLYFNDKKNPKAIANTFSYPTREVPYQKSQDKHKKEHKKERAIPKQINQQIQDFKQNQSLFRNMQKCNQKMQFYKLKGSLEEQKRSMLEQQNYFLKVQNQQLKSELQNFKKEIKRLSKKVQKLSFQIQKYQLQQNDLHINIPSKFKQNINKSSQHAQICENCVQLSEKLQQQRSLYERDRKYLKQQVENLNESLDEAKRKQKSIKKQLQNKKCLPQQKQIQIIQKFKSKQNQLKKQLTLCYQAFQQKCKLISQLQQKIDQFQQENRRILKLLTLYDQNYNNKNLNSYEKNFPLKKEERSRSSYHAKDKNFTNFYPSSTKNHADIYEEEKFYQSRNRGRKCGSIKKVEVQ